MSPIAASTEWAEIEGLLEREGVLADGVLAQLQEYAGLLVAANERVNLVSRKSVDRFVPDQLRPSLAALLLEGGSAARVIDVGSGGGLPGIPLAIARPSWTLHLVESRGKKAEFLKECSEALGLQNTVVHACRIEDPTLELREAPPADVIVSRAAGMNRKALRACRALVADPASVWVFASPEEGERVWSSLSGEALTSLQRV